MQKKRESSRKFSNRYILALAVVVLVVIAAVVIVKNTPTNRHMADSEYFGTMQDDEAAIILGNEIIADRAIVQGDSLYLPYNIVRDTLNGRFYWDGDIAKMLFTTATQEFEIPVNSTSYSVIDGVRTTDKVSEGSFSETIILRPDDDRVTAENDTGLYVSAAFLQQYTQAEFSFTKAKKEKGPAGAGHVRIRYEWGQTLKATTTKEAAVRFQGGIKSPILADLGKGEQVTVLEELENWTRVLTDNGYIGYVKQSRITIPASVNETTELAAPEYPCIQSGLVSYSQASGGSGDSKDNGDDSATADVDSADMSGSADTDSAADVDSADMSGSADTDSAADVDSADMSGSADTDSAADTGASTGSGQKVSLVWHQVATEDANNNLKDAIDGVTGVNVISPTWFSLADNDGNITSIGSKKYVKTANKAGMAVWGLVSDFSGDMDTSAVLASTAARRNAIGQLVDEALDLGLDGINLDFEYMEEADALAYTQFVRELSIECRNNELVLSVDLKPPYDFNKWMNRKEIGTVTDYLINMGYDEHYAGSEPGSVASLPYEETAIQETISQGVPAAKIISAMPLYTRIWYSSAGGVSSEVLSMGGAAATLDSWNLTPAWDAATFQHYVDWTTGDGVRCQIWLEDADSIAAKARIIPRYGLGGAAIWSLGFQDSSIWSVIDKNINLSRKEAESAQADAEQEALKEEQASPEEDAEAQTEGEGESEALTEAGQE